MSNIKRNDLCPCGSGKKYKKCCGKTEAQLQQKRHEGLKSRALSHVPQTPMGILAKKVFKVLKDTADSDSLSQHSFSKGLDVKKETAPQEPQSYHSLEELIGMEGGVPPQFRNESTNIEK